MTVIKLNFEIFQKYQFQKDSTWHGSNILTRGTPEVVARSSVDAEVMLFQPGYLGVVAQAMHALFYQLFFGIISLKKY